MTKNLSEIKKEVENMKDNLGIPVEPHIKDLVIGLRKFNIETISSCEGHDDKNKLKYPWVDMNPSEAPKVIKIIAWYNMKVLTGKIQGISWVILPRNILRLMPTNRNLSLKELQKGAVMLGKKIQESKLKNKFVIN